MQRISYYIFTLFSIIGLISCNSVKNTNSNNKLPTITYINSIEIPYHTTFQNTSVGGLSGIDYDTTHDLYYIISDDRSEKNPARFYTAKMSISKTGIEQITFVGVSTLKNSTQQNYTNANIDPVHSIDPEDIRYYPNKQLVAWSNEGERLFRKTDTILLNPTIYLTDNKGNFINEFELPDVLKIKKMSSGPRRNGVLEGISFNENYSILYTNVEEPLFEDGAQATLSEGGNIRIFAFDVLSRKNTQQYIYKIEPIANEPKPKDAFAINGVSAMLHYKNHQIFMLERSYSTGITACSVKLFLCDLKNTIDIDLKSKLPIVSKKLVLDLSTLGIFTGNLEGMTYGPKLKNGKRSLILISDNNFSENQKTQLILFELDEP